MCGLREIYLNPLNLFLHLQNGYNKLSHKTDVGINGVIFVKHWEQHLKKWKSLSPWTVAYQALLSIGFSRQEYWSVLPCPPPRYLLDSGIKTTPLTSLSLVDRFFTTSATWRHGSNLNVHQWRTDKEDVVHTYNRILLSHKRNKTVPFAESWIDLVTVIQSEESQKEKTSRANKFQRKTYHTNSPATQKHSPDY